MRQSATRSSRRRSTGPERLRLERRLASAVVVAPPANRATVAFGATVSVRNRAGRTRSYTLVGDDEVDVSAGKVGAASPLGTALAGHNVGDVVRWPRPIGDESLTILAVGYEPLEAP